MWWWMYVQVCLLFYFNFCCMKMSTFKSKATVLLYIILFSAWLYVTIFLKVKEMMILIWWVLHHMIGILFISLWTKTLHCHPCFLCCQYLCAILIQIKKKYCTFVLCTQIRKMCSMCCAFMNIYFLNGRHRV